MPYPYDNFASNVGANPFGASSYGRLFGQKPQTAKDLLPEIDPADERSTAGWLLEKGLGGLGYVGSLFDKTFGARALRGVLGGKPEELLSIIPGSDSIFNITDPQNEVSGRQLLSSIGLADARKPDEPFNWQDDILGMAAEIALDPSTYLSLGLTAAGKAAKKGAQLGEGFISQLKSGQRGLNFKVPFTGMDPAELLSGPAVVNAASGARSLATFPTRAFDYLSGATTGYKPLSGAQGLAYDYLGEPLGRFANRLFAPAVKGAGVAEGQDLGRAMSAEEKALEREALGQYAQRELDLAKIAGKDASPERQDALNRAFIAKVEDADTSVLHDRMRATALDNAAAAIGDWHLPIHKDDAKNLKDWRLGKADLNPTNQEYYNSSVKKFDKDVLEGRLASSGDLAKVDVGDLASRSEAFTKVASEKGGQFVALDSDNMAGLAAKVGPEKAADFQRRSLGIIREELAKSGDVSLHKGGTDAMSDEFSAIVAGGSDAVDQALARADGRIRQMAVDLGYGGIERVSPKTGPSLPGFTMHREPIDPGARLPNIEQESGFGIETKKLRRADAEKTAPLPSPGIGTDATPLTSRDLQLLNAGRDLIDAGYAPQRLPGGDFRFAPTDDLIRTQRDDYLNKILDNPALGPSSLIEPTTIDLPRTMKDRKAQGLVESPSPAVPYYKALQDWADNPTAGLDHPLFTDPVFGDRAQKALAQAADVPDVKQVPLHKAIDFSPPAGVKENLEWASKNLAPDELEAFNGLVASEKNFVRRIKEIEKSTGAMGGSMNDSMIDYFTRQMTRFPKGDPRNQASASMAGYFRDLKASNAAFEARKDIFRDVPGGTSQINAWTMDPALSGPNRTLTEEQVAMQIRRDLTGMDVPAKDNPAWKQAEGLAKWLGGLPAHHVDDKVPFFSADIPQVMFQRTRGKNKVVAAANTYYRAFERFGNTEEFWKQQGRESISARDLAQQMNLTGADEAGSIAAQKLAGKAGLPELAKGEAYSINDLKDLHIPKDVADDMLRFNQATQTPAVLKPVLDLYDKAVDLTKTYLTRPFISFHTRNLATGLFNTWRSGAISAETLGRDFQTMKDTFDFLRGRGENILPGVSRDELWKELVQGRIAFGPNTSMTADVLSGSGEIVQQGIRKPAETGNTVLGDVKSRIGQAASDVKASPKEALNPFNTKNSFVQMMSEGGQQIEDFLRTNHYVGLRKRGWTPEAAADEVMKYQIDYSNLTGFEKSTAKRVLPWYAFSKGNLPPILEDLVSQPYKITTPTRLTTGGRPQGEFVPSYIGEGAALPLGTSEDGTQRYISSFGLPIEDEAVKAMGSLVKGDFSRVGEQVLGSTFPWIKSPLEMIFDKQLYSGRPLSELKPYEFLSAVLPEKTARVATEIAANTPASRTLSTVNKLMDDRKPIEAQLANMLTGVRVTDVDLTRAMDSATQRAMAEQLIGAPGVRTRQEVYVPIDKIPNLSPEDALRLSLYMKAEQRLREQAAQKRKSGP